MASGRRAFIGIDVAFAKAKRLLIVICVQEDGRLVPLPLADKKLPPPPQGRGNAATLDADAEAAERYRGRAALYESGKPFVQQ